MWSRCCDERGAAMPLAILWIALLSLGAVVGLSRLSAERRTNGNFQAEVDAFALGQAGLGRYFAGVSSPPGVSFDTTVTGLPGGSVAVSVRRLREAAGNDPALYVIRAYATNTGAVRYGADIPASERTVAQVAIWQDGTMDVKSAWTSIPGLQKNGGAGTISGTDQCGVLPGVPGVAVPVVAADGDPGYDQNRGAPVPAGNPPILHPAPTPESFAPLVNIDWDGIVNGGALQADYNLTGTSGWPSSFADWPSIFVEGSVSLNPPLSGQGLIVVTGNVTLQGSFSWKGVILAGGVITSNGNQTITGALVSGLNVKLGQTVGVSDMGNGNKTIRYNSCDVTQALQDLGGLVPLANAWVDNWPTW